VKRRCLRRFGAGYVKRACWRRLGAQLHEMGMSVSSGGLVTRNKGVCAVSGLGYAKRAVGIVWVRNYAKWGVCVV